MARIVRFHQVGGPEVLRIEEIDVGAPGPGHIRLSVETIGPNRSETMARRGAHALDPVLPSRLGCEAAGTVEAVGSGVGDFRIGDKVSTLPGLPMSDYGVYGEKVIFPAEHLVRVPSILSMEQAAALWMTYMTAYGGLIDLAGVRPGDAVVIPAGASSVGLAAIQIVNALGGISIATTRTAAKYSGP